MKPVHQTIIDQGKGNCLTAALASVFELPIEDVPNFIKDFGAGYFEEAVNLWLRNKGYALLRVRLVTDKPDDKNKVRKGRMPTTGDEIHFHSLPENMLCIAAGKSPRGEWYHSVVGTIVDGHNFELLHDPHPDGTGLDGLPVSLEFFVPLNPAQMKRDL